MKDNPLVSAVRSALKSRLAASSYGLSAVEVKQFSQPTPQGVPTGPVVFMNRIMKNRVGHPQRKEDWNPDTEQFDYIESVQYESTFQFTASAPQDPANDTEFTADDYLSAAAAALQSDPVLISLRAQGIGVLRIGAIRGGFAIGDDGNPEEQPSFDVVFTHRDTTTDVLAPVVSQEIIINRV